MMENTFDLIRQSQAGDKEAKEQLIEENAGLIWNIVRRFVGRGVEMEDLYQIGAIGLIRAIDRFDFNFDVKFSTYAVPLITGEIKRFLRDDGMLKVSRGLKETKWKIRSTTEQFIKQYGRDPDIQELAEILQMDGEDIVLAMEAHTRVESIYQTVYQSDGSEVQLMDRIPEKENAQEELMNHLLLEQLMEELTDREKELITLRYYENMTQLQVAGRMGISQVQVSRMEKKILTKMRIQAE